MGEFKFETDFLNEYFTKTTGKEQFTLEELKTSYLSIRMRGERISQNDLDTLMTLAPQISLSQIDISGLIIKKANLKDLSLYRCNLSDCQFQESTIKSLSLSGCNLSEEYITELKAIQGLKRLDITGKQERDGKKIKEDYPNYSELSQMEKWNIISDEKYIIPETLDISRLSELSSLEQLGLDHITIDSPGVEHFGSFNNLHTLNISGVNIGEEVVIPNIPTLQTLSISSLEDLKTLGNFKEIKELGINQNGRSIQNIELLRTFMNLEGIAISGISRADNYLPNTQTLDNISLKGCDISDISFLDQYSQLQRIDLSRNSVDISALERLKILAQNGVRLKIENTPLAEELKGQAFHISDKKTLEEVKKCFQIYYSSGELTQYDLLTCTRPEKITITGNQVLETLISTGLISEFAETNIKLKLDQFEGLSQDAITWMSTFGKLKIEIASFRGLTPENLNRLRKK